MDPLVAAFDLALSDGEQCAGLRSAPRGSRFRPAAVSMLVLACRSRADRIHLASETRASGSSTSLCRVETTTEAQHPDHTPGAVVPEEGWRSRWLSPVAYRAVAPAARQIGSWISAADEFSSRCMASEQPLGDLGRTAHRVE